MTEPAAAPQTSDDARLELAVAAAATERANKPRWIVFLAAGLLAITLVYTLTAVTARAAAFAQISKARDRTNQVLTMKAKIDQENAKLARRATAHNERVGETIESYAKTAGVKLSGPVIDSKATAMSNVGMQQYKYTARGQNQDAYSVFLWLREIETNSEAWGLELTRLKLSPGTTVEGSNPPIAGWNVDVEFIRWEKTK
jgi:hypothetical protein